VSHPTSPYITVYPWSGSGFGTKFANSGTAIPDNGNGVAFSPSDDAIATAHDASPFVTAYRWSNSGFGTKYNNPSIGIADTGYGVAFGRISNQYS
jgi:hypothetical protein